jgi:hypothetical protein
VTLDKDHADDVLLVARDEDRVLADEDAHRRFVGDLTQTHRLEHDRLPLLLAHPRRVAGLRLLGGHVEDRDDAVVPENPLNSCR